MRLKQEFPQNFNEVVTSAITCKGTSTNVYYKQNYIDYIGGASSGTSPATYEAAYACTWH